MNKTVLIAILLFSINSYAQSNEKGTIHAKLGGGVGFGSGTSIVTPTGQSEITNKGSIGAGYGGLEGQYGIANKIAAGLSFNYGGLFFIPETNFSKNSFGYSMAISTTGSYFFVNKNDLNIYASPSLGIVTFYSNSYKVGETDGSGILADLAVGFNHYYSEHVGINFDLAYNYFSLDKTTIYKEVETKKEAFTGGFIMISSGIVFKF